jgi:predicted chitinase
MSYSKERLPEVWGVFSKTGKRVEKGQGKYNWNALAAQHERQPEKLANFVYGGQFHNNRSGDGWKYRGRGFNGITFKSGYEKYSSITGIDLVSNPDRLNDINVASEVAVKFLINGVKSLGKDPMQFTNQQDATYYATKANAGGREIKYDETYAKAKEVEKNFLITA